MRLLRRLPVASVRAPPPAVKDVPDRQRPLRIRSPLYRKGTFPPQLVSYRQTLCVRFVYLLISLYSRALSVREIQAHLSFIFVS